MKDIAAANIKRVNLYLKAYLFDLTPLTLSGQGWSYYSYSDSSVLPHRWSKSHALTGGPGLVSCSALSRALIVTTAFIEVHMHYISAY